MSEVKDFCEKGTHEWYEQVCRIGGLKSVIEGDNSVEYHLIVRCKKCPSMFLKDLD